MANRNSASKQAAGGASRSPNPRPANRNPSRSGSTGNPGNTFSKPNKPSSSKAQTRTAPKPPQPQVATNHSSNGTRSQGTGNGAPKSQGANGRAEATSGHKALQDRSMYQAAPKRTGNGPNNNPQKAQGHAPVPQFNVSLKPQTPKSKYSQPLTRGHSPAPNSVLSLPPYPGNTQPSLFSGAGQKVFHHQSSMPKQSGHTHAHTPKAQKHAPTPQSFFSVSQTHQQPTNSGKNTANCSPKVQTTMQHAPRGGQAAIGPKSPSHNHKASSHSHLGTGNRSFDSMNSSGPKCNSSSGLHQATMSAKHSPAAAEGSGPLGRFLSWFSSPGREPVQPTKKPMLNPSKAKGLESLPNGSQTRRIQVSDFSTLKGTGSGVTNVSPKNGPTLNSTLRFSDHNKGNNNDGVRSKPPLILPKKESTLANNKESWHGQKTSLMSNKEKANNNASSKPWAENRSLESRKPSPTKSMHLPHSAKTLPSTLAETKGAGCNIKSVRDCSPKSSGSKHLSSHSSISNGRSFQALPIVAQTRQLVPSAQNILTAKLPPTLLSPRSQAAKNKCSSPKQGVTGASQKPHPAAVPTLSLRGMLGQVSSFFGWTVTAPSAPPIDKRAQARQAQDAPKLSASTRQAPESSKDDNSSKSHPAPTPTSTSPSHKRPELSRKEVVLCVKNRLHNVRDWSGKSNTSASGTELSRMQWLIGSNATLPNKRTPDRHEGASKLMRSDVGLSRGTSSVSTKARMATNLTFVSSRATDRAQKSSKHQPVRGSSTVKTIRPTSVPRRKELQIRSSSSKVLFRPPKKTTTLRKGLLRQYAPTLIWRTCDRPNVTSAYSTVTAAPLPTPPRNELMNRIARKTIAQNPDLFKIVSPIKVEAFKKNLKGHPNPNFVDSVVRALKTGFWPWSDTRNPTLPTTHDGSRQRQPTTNKNKVRFIRQQRDEEIGLKRWSKPFGPKLLPGMHSSPIGAVPKSTPGKYRLIIDQSCGPHALNSTIPKSQVKVKLDNIHDLGTALLAVRKKYPKRKLCLFKSDVRSAYRQLPMHPLWQIKQVVSIDGQRHIDRCNTFGNRGGGWNWDSVASLVNWIGTEKKNIPDLLGYVDDNFSWEFAGNTKYYKPYKKHLPAKQTRLLELWDELGIPHDEDKQLSGPCLPIIGYEVDANAMTVKVPNEKKARVIRLLRNYAHEGKSYTLRELQSVAGSTNEILSLYPYLRRGLRGLFDEMAGKVGPSTKLTVTKSVACSLSKLADYLEHVRPVPIQQKTMRRLRPRAR